jgi:hypothetical protein
MKSLSTIGKLVVFLLLASSSARAECLLDVTSALTLTDPLQSGRLNRKGIQQDWSGRESFPGVLNASTDYHYHAYLVNVGRTPFIQIDFDSVPFNTFVSAYDTSYRPEVGFDTNWLGDEGASGNYLGVVDPAFFQVLIPQNHDLLIIINNTGAADVGVGDPFHLIVEGFVDGQFTEPEHPDADGRSRRHHRPCSAGESARSEGKAKIVGEVLMNNMGDSQGRLPQQFSFNATSRSIDQGRVRMSHSPRIVSTGSNRVARKVGSQHEAPATTRTSALETE